MKKTVSLALALGLLLTLCACGAQAPVPAPRTRRGAGTVRKGAPVLAASCLLPRSLSADLGWGLGQESLVGFVR